MSTIFKICISINFLTNKWLRRLIKRNTHVQCESCISSAWKVMTKVKVFVQASHTDANSRTMTLAPWTYLSSLQKRGAHTKAEI